MPEDRVTSLDAPVVDDAVFLDDADAEAREVLAVAVIHARHLGSLAADERGTGLRATLRDALDHGLGNVHPQGLPVA